MAALLAFVGALAGAVIGAYVGVTVERLRGRHELALRRRDDVKDALLEVHRHALAALMAGILLDAEAAKGAEADEGRESSYDLEVQDERFQMMRAYYDVELLLPEASMVGERVKELSQVLVSPAPAGDERSFTDRALAARGVLKDALRGELNRL